MGIFLLPYCCCVPSGNVPFPVGFQVPISEGLMNCTHKALQNGGQIYLCSTVLTRELPQHRSQCANGLLSSPCPDVLKFGFMKSYAGCGGFFF